MKIYKYFILSSLVMLVSSGVLAGMNSQFEGIESTKPSIDLQPEDVVNIVIKALAKNDTPHIDAGIETTFAFASPSNKVNTGPFEKFSRMVKRYPYGIMLNHISSEFSEVVIQDKLAYQIVQLTGYNGKKGAFAFRLGRQIEGEFKDMWMTEAVWPLNHPKDTEPSF